MKQSLKTVLKKNNGFTLVELMVTIVLTGLIIGLAGTFFHLTFQSEKRAEDQFLLQANMRQASTVLNNAIRKSTVTFTMQQTTFEGSKQEKWNYFGVKDGNKIVQYIWNPVTTKHDEKILIEAKDGITYKLFFTQRAANTKLIQFDLECIPDGNEAKKIVVHSELSAMNSVTIDNGGSEDDPASAIAYRSDPTPKPETVTTSEEITLAIALVLDQSGSMSRNMNGGTASGTYPSKISSVKNQASKLITQFSTQNIWACIIPYSYNANNPGTMQNCRTTTGVTNLQAAISGLSAGGYTNTGDGLRRAYYRMQKFKEDNPTKTVKYYIILLTDGNPTYRSITGTSIYLTDDGNATKYAGTGSEDSTNITNNLAYVSAISTKINASSVPIRTFVIGFSNISTDINRCKEIATDCTGTGDERKGTYYEANSEIALENTLKVITQTMLDETWHIYGIY